MNCPDCKAAMKPLFTGFYCPNDCDRPKPAVKKVTTVPTPTGTIDFSKIKKATAGSQGQWFWPMFPLGAPAAAPPPRPDDECRAPYCGSKGVVTHTITMTHADGTITDDMWYSCNLCASTWCVTKKKGTTNNNGSTQASPSFIFPTVPAIPDPVIWNHRLLNGGSRA